MKLSIDVVGPEPADKRPKAPHNLRWMVEVYENGPLRWYTRNRSISRRVARNHKKAYLFRSVSGGLYAFMEYGGSERLA